MGERFGERKPPETNETKRNPETLRATISPESERDLQAKEIFSSVVGDIKTMAQQDVASLEKLMQELKERELSFSNFVSPENMLGQAGWIRGDGKTFSSDRLETVESVVETAKRRIQGLVQLEYLLKSGSSLADIRKDPQVQAFFSSPEGKLLEGVAAGMKDTKTLESEYYLEKAREIRDKIIRGDELAQDWYDKLKGTPLEAVAEKEKMDLGDRTLRKGREFANSMLGLDSLATLVAGAGIGRAAGFIISKSENLRNLSLAGSTLLNESKVAKFAVPGVNVLQAKAGDSALAAFSKGGASFIAEIAKGFAYTEVARAAGGEKMAHAMSYPLMFIPGLKGQFESTLKVSLAENPANFAKFREWVVAKYGTPEKLEQAIQAGMKETYNRSKWNVGVEEMQKIYKEISSAVQTLFESAKQTGINMKNTIANQVGARFSGSSAGLAEKGGTVAAETPKPSASPQNPKHQSETSATQSSQTDPEKGGQNGEPKKDAPPPKGSEKPDSRERVDNLRLAETSLTPDEIRFLNENFFNGSLEKALGVRVGLEHFIDRGFHGAVFEVPGKNQVVKLPLNAENLATLSKEMGRHDLFQDSFDVVKKTYSPTLETSGLSSDVIAMRMEAAGNIDVPRRLAVPDRTDVYMMDRLNNVESIDYFKHVQLLKRDFPDYLAQHQIDLGSMNTAQVDKLTTWLYETRGMKKPDISKINIPLLPKEQMNALIDIVRNLNRNGIYHGDLHQGNILIGKETVGSGNFRKIYIIDFDTAGRQQGDLHSLRIDKSLSGSGTREVEELMEKYPDEPPDVIRLMHSLGRNITPNK